MTALVAYLLLFCSQQGPHWSISSRHVPVWDGQPYIPVGARISGTRDSILAAKAAGITDVVVELPDSGIGWQDAFQTLEQAHMRYVVDIASAASGAVGVCVEPSGYRVDGITSDTPVSLSLPGATSVLAVLATKQDGSIESRQLVKTPDGLFSINQKVNNTLEHVLLLYPREKSLQVPDYWEGFDEHRDQLISSLTRFPPGPGFRGLMNPLGTVVNLASKGTRFVPTEGFFRAELSSYLETKYHNLDTALKVWSMRASDINSFDRLARLVPMWSGMRGVSFYWDPSTDKMYECDSRQSLAWRDIDDVIEAAAERRYRRLVATLKNLVAGPIIQEWAGYASAYETQSPAIEGVAVDIDSDRPSEIAEEAAPGVSAVLRWPANGYAVASRIALPKENSAEMGSVVEQLAAIGIRGFYFRAEDVAELKQIGELAAKPIADPTFAADLPKPLFYPESATNPAHVQRLPGGTWWLPAPWAGNRVDLGSEFFGYRLIDPKEPYFVIWTIGAARRVRLRVTAPKSLRFQTIDGSDPKPRYLRNGVEVTLSECPLLIKGSDEIPVPEPAVLEAGNQFQSLSKLAESMLQDISEDSYFFKDSLNGFERNPGGSFSVMRQVIARLKTKLAPYTWVGAERVADTNFSEIANIPGCSNANALTLQTALTGRDYYADFEIPVRSVQDQDIWLAARIPATLRRNVRVTVGGQTLAVPDEDTSPYGLGFAWYKLGRTRFAGQRVSVKVTVSAVDGADMAIDTLVAAPIDFKPNGAFMPDW